MKIDVVTHLISRDRSLFKSFIFITCELISSKLIQSYIKIDAKRKLLQIQKKTNKISSTVPTSTPGKRRT